MKYDVSTQVEGTRIVSLVDLVGPSLNALGDNIRETIIRQVIDTQDAGVRNALKKIGWREPGEIAAIDVPCAPTRDDPLGMRYRRVTADDVRRMEEQLAAIRRLVRE